MGAKTIYHLAPANVLYLNVLQRLVPKPQIFRIVVSV